MDLVAFILEPNKLRAHLDAIIREGTIVYPDGLDLIRGAVRRFAGRTVEDELSLSQRPFFELCVTILAAPIGVCLDRVQRVISNPEYTTFVSLLLRRAARGGLPQRAVDELYAHVLRRESLISTTSPGFDARTLDRARQHVEARTADPLDPNTDARLSFDLGSYLVNAKDDRKEALPLLKRSARALGLVQPKPVQPFVLPDLREIQLLIGRCEGSQTETSTDRPVSQKRSAAPQPSTRPLKRAKPADTASTSSQPQPQAPALLAIARWFDAKDGRDPSTPIDDKMAHACLAHVSSSTGSTSLSDVAAVVNRVPVQFSRFAFDLVNVVAVRAEAKDRKAPLRSLWAALQRLLTVFAPGSSFGTDVQVDATLRLAVAITDNTKVFCEAVGAGMGRADIGSDRNVLSTLARQRDAIDLAAQVLSSCGARLLKTTSQRMPELDVPLLACTVAWVKPRDATRRDVFAMAAKTWLRTRYGGRTTQLQSTIKSLCSALSAVLGTRAQRASTDAIAAAADMAKVAVLSSCAGDDRKALVWFARAIGHQASAGATQRDAGLLADARVVATGVRCLLNRRQNGLACVLSCVSKPPLSRLAQRLIEESSSAAGLATTYRHVTDVGVLEWAVHWHNTRGENKERDAAMRALRGMGGDATAAPGRRKSALVAIAKGIQGILGI